MTCISVSYTGHMNVSWYAHLFSNVHQQNLQLLGRPYQSSCENGHANSIQPPPKFSYSTLLYHISLSFQTMFNKMKYLNVIFSRPDSNVPRKWPVRAYMPRVYIDHVHARSSYSILTVRPCNSESCSKKLDSLISTLVSIWCTGWIPGQEDR
jgi:hypothetical protein